MKFTNLRSFNRHLKETSSDHLSSLYVIGDQDAYTLYTLAEITAKTVSADSSNKKSFYSETLNNDTLVSCLESYPLFSQKEVIVIHHIEDLKKSSLTILKRFIENPSSHLTLILTQGKKDLDKAFSKLVQLNGVCLDLFSEKPWDREERLANWMYHKLKNHGKEIAPVLAKKCVIRLGLDHGRIASEIDKLIAYKYESSVIEEADIELLCPPNEKETVWHLGQAIFNHEAQKTLKIWQNLKLQGTVLIALIQSLRFQFYEALKLLDADSKKGDLNALFPSQNPKMLEKNLAQAKRFGRQHLMQGMEVLADYELIAKNSAVQAEDQVEIMLIKLLKTNH